MAKSLLYITVICQEVLLYVREILHAEERKFKVHFIIRKLREKGLQSVGFSGCFLSLFGFSISCVLLCQTWNPEVSTTSVSVKDNKADEGVSGVQETLKNKSRCTLL